MGVSTLWDQPRGCTVLTNKKYRMLVLDIHLEVKENGTNFDTVLTDEYVLCSVGDTRCQTKIHTAPDMELAPGSQLRRHRDGT